MFVWSFKASTAKLVGIIVLSAAALALLIGMLPRSATEIASIDTIKTGQSKKIVFSGIKTQEDLLGFINHLGIEVEPTPVEVVEVQIPSKFDAVLQKYNAVQNLQGFDLKKYKNKTVTRHTYKLKSDNLEHPAQDSQQLLSILIYRNKVIGGDICSQENGGVVSGFIDYKGRA